MFRILNQSHYQAKLQTREAKALYRIMMSQFTTLYLYCIMMSQFTTLYLYLLLFLG
jgi:hypothetical protein